MALTRKTMQEKVRTIQVTWEDETVEVGVYPGRYTPDLVAEVANTQAEAEAADTQEKSEAALQRMGEAVASLLAYWDVYEDDKALAAGKRLPVTAANIASFPLAFVQEVMTSVGEAVRPPARKG